MKRREFITLLAGTVAWRLTARAATEQAAKTTRLTRCEKSAARQIF
jgi:hypothetical protein